MKTMKRCTCCGRELPLSAFYLGNTRRGECRDCEKISRRLYCQRKLRLSARTLFDMGLLFTMDADELTFVAEHKTREYWQAMKDQEEGALLA